MLKLLGVYALIMSCVETGRSLLERRELIKGKGKGTGDIRQACCLAWFPEGKEGEK